MTYSPTPEELAALKTANAALLASPDAYCDIVATIVFALGSAQQLQSPETADEIAEMRSSLLRLDEVAVARGREVNRLLTRVAELEAAQEQQLADAGDWLDEVGEENAAYLVRTCDIPVAARQQEDPHDSDLHHDYATPRDLPTTLDTPGSLR